MIGKVNTMIKKLILSMLVLFTLVGCSNSKIEKKELKVLDDLYPTYLERSVGYILSYDRTGKVITGYSSAFVYKKNSSSSYIITSNSIVSDDYKYVFVINETRVECEYIGSDSNLNLAVLSFDNDLYKVMEIDKGASSNLKVGNSIHVSMLGSFSSHLEDNMTLSKGIISSKSATYCINNYLFSCNNYMVIDNVSVVSGQGAPVLDYYGHIVGVVSHVNYMDNNNVFSYVSTIEQVDRAINNVLKNNKYARGDLHVDTKEYYMLPSNIKETIEIADIKSSDVIISSVTGYSQSVGVPVNCKIVSLGGVDIKDKNHLVELMYGYDSGDSVVLKVQVSDDVYEEYTILL